MKRIYVLVSLLLLIIAAGVWVYQPPSNKISQSQLMFEDLAQHSNDLQSVKIENAQGIVFSAQKLGDLWLATLDPALPVYPISQDDLANLVTTLLQAKLVEPKTTRPDNYSRLGLQDVANIDSLASLVTLKAKERTWRVLVGNKVSFAQGSYVRFPENKQSWRTDKSINLPLDQFSWLKQPILPFEAEDIVAISRVDKEEWKILRDGDDRFQLTPLAPGRSLEYQGILDSILNSLISLNFEQLIAKNEVVASAITILAELEVQLLQGEPFRVVISEMDNQYFVSFPNELQSEYWQKWRYQISHFSAQQLIKTSEDFLSDESAEPSDKESVDSQTIDEGESPN